MVLFWFSAYVDDGRRLTVIYTATDTAGEVQVAASPLQACCLAVIKPISSLIFTDLLHLDEFNRLAATELADNLHAASW